MHQHLVAEVLCQSNIRNLSGLNACIVDELFRCGLSIMILFHQKSVMLDMLKDFLHLSILLLVI